MVTQITIPLTPALLTTPTPGASSFTQKLLSFTVKLAQSSGLNQPASFAGGGDTATFQGSRASVRIENSGTPSGATARALIWGLTLDLMNQLSTLGMQISIIPRNTLTVEAGDINAGMSLVFAGTITQAYADFNAAPDVPFIFECNSGLADAVLPATPLSYPQSTDVGTIMSSIASQLGYGFENNGVSVMLPPSYFPGSAQTQWQKVARDANINAALTAGSGRGAGLVLAIWPKNKSRNGAVPLIAPPPAGAMISYPTYTQQGVMVRTVYNPQIGFGGQFQIQGSQLIGANKTWVVHKLDHSLDSLIPGGRWESAVHGYGTNVPFPVVPPS